jgi:hypothetical protein
MTDTETLMQTSCPLEMLAPMKSVEILNTAASLVGGDRNTTHGSKQKNFDNTAALWSAYLGVPVSAEQVAICMVLLKVSRTACGTPIDDHYTDMAGYAAIAAEVRK